MARTAPPRFARNLAAVLAWELLWGFGAACTSSAIFVPFLSRLEGSKRLVGTVGLATLLGIPALFVSLWLAHRLKRRRTAVALLFAGQVVGWVVLGGVLLTGTAPSSSTIVPVVYVTQAVLAFVAGVSMAPTYQLLTGVFAERFGTAQGLQLLCRQVSGVVGGLWAATALDAAQFPQSYGVVFLVGGIVMTGSNVAVFFFSEEESSEAAPADPFLPALRRTLAEARSLASLAIVVATVSTAVSVQAFLVVSALERLHLPDAYAGVFASVTLAAQGIGGALAGRAGDRLGHGRLLVVSLAIQFVAFALVITLGARSQFYVALVLAGLVNAALQISLAGLTARLSPKESQGAFMAIMRWAFSVISAVATAVAAWGVDHAGYAVVFGSCLFPVVVSMEVARRLARRERS
jgi:MFS family permease